MEVTGINETYRPGSYLYLSILLVPVHGNGGQRQNEKAATEQNKGLIPIHCLQYRHVVDESRPSFYLCLSTLSINTKQRSDSSYNDVLRIRDALR